MSDRNLADVPSVEPYYFNDQSSPLYLCLKEIMPIIMGSAGASAIWEGWKVTEPDSGLPYIRIQMRNTFGHHSPDLNQEVRILVAVHLFEKGERVKKGKKQHNHRFPFLVAPFGLGKSDETEDEPLYSMPWEHGSKSGTLEVREGEIYSVYDALSFTHVVHSERSHGSIVLADTTKEALRADRLKTEPLEPEALKTFLQRALAGVLRIGTAVADPARAEQERRIKKIHARVRKMQVERNPPFLHRSCTGID